MLVYFKTNEYGIKFKYQLQTNFRFVYFICFHHISSRTSFYNAEKNALHKCKLILVYIYEFKIMKIVS